MMMNASFLLQKKIDQLSIKKNSWYKPMCSNKIVEDKNDSNHTSHHLTFTERIVLLNNIRSFCF